jgi:hypothetical protein
VPFKQPLSGPVRRRRSGYHAAVEPIRTIEELRRHRARPQRETSIAPIVGAWARNATRVQRRLGELIALWEELLPAEVASRTAVTGLRGGTLQVNVDSAAAMYELDRLLRGGLEQSLRERWRGSLMRVRVRLGPLGPDENAG